MAKMIVEISKINQILPHENADRLEIVKIKGWYSIVSKDCFEVGDLCIFVPPDAIIPEKLIEEYNLEYLKKDGRIKTVKLRGVISQGLVLSVPNKSWKEGRDVAKELGITKYEAPVPKYQTRQKESIKNVYLKYKEGKMPFRRFVKKVFSLIKENLKPKKNPNPLFHKYTDINNIKNYDTVFNEGDEVYISEKVHGCLQAKTKILLANGDTKTIQDVVENKYQGDVLGLDEKGNLVSSKIKNWFINGKTKKWLKISYQRPTQRGNAYFTVICTPNHKFYIPKTNEYLRAESLKLGDEVFCSYFNQKIPYHIEQILIGKMLGDGHLSSNSVNFGHKKDHKNYIDYTLKSLGMYAGNYQKNTISGYGTEMLRARSKSSEEIKYLFSNWFIDKEKQVPREIELSPIALAFWYMDDGSLSCHDSQRDRVCLATNGFNEKSIDNLLNALKKLNIIGTKFKSNGWRIRINANDAVKFFTLISPYIPTCMKYKLPKEYKKVKAVNFPNFELSNITRSSKRKIIKIEPYNNVKNNSKKYDIETETHNFFANNCLVHNSNFRAGRLPINSSSLFGKIKSLFVGKYEFVYGSHNVQKSVLKNGHGFYGEDVYGQIAKRYKLEESIPNDYIVYGEILGNKIQELDYGLKDSIDVRFFDVKYKGEYLSYPEFLQFCCENRLPTVPKLFVGKYSEKLKNELTNGDSVLAKQYGKKQITEGCVVKSYKEESHPRTGRKILKSISAEYLLSKNRTEYH